MTSTADFLHTLFDAKLPEHYILIWTKRGDEKISGWFNDIDKAAAYCESISGKADVYFGVGLSDRVRPRNQRASESEVAALACLWLDIDYESNAHKKPNLPGREAALAFLSKNEPKPTILLHTGHGYQAFWCFKEPWLLDTATERAKLKNLSVAWQGLWATRAAVHGWTMDSTVDLARVMRVAGTTNIKEPDAPCVVEIVSQSDWRAGSLESFEEYLPQETQSGKPLLPAVAIDAFTLDPKVVPDGPEWTNVCAMVAKVKPTYDRKRRDLTDQSPSGYDMSMAAMLVRCGWKDQDIINVLVAARREHGEELKLDRPDYYKRTLANARASHVREKAAEELITASADDPDALGVLGTLLGIPITRIVRYASEPALYYLEVGPKRICIGEISRLTDYRVMRNVVLDLTKFQLPPMNKGIWDRATKLLRVVAIDEPLGPETTEAGQAMVWVSDYLDSHSVVVFERASARETEDALSNRWPIEQRGETFVQLSDLQSWLRLAKGVNVTSRQLAVMLRSAGMAQTAVPCTVQGKPTTRSMWLVKEREKEYAH